MIAIFVLQNFRLLRDVWRPQLFLRKGRKANVQASGFGEKVRPRRPSRFHHVTGRVADRPLSRFSSKLNQEDQHIFM